MSVIPLLARLKQIALNHASRRLDSIEFKSLLNLALIVGKLKNDSSVSRSDRTLQPRTQQ